MTGPPTQTVLSVLTYHSIDGSGSPVSVTPSEFVTHIETLAAHGWHTLPLAAALEGHRAGVWPPRSLLVTFDDGYQNVLEHAAPVLAAHDFHATVFIATERVGSTMRRTGEPAWTPDLPLLDWSGVRALADAGWSVGSHSCTHRALPAVSAVEADRELAVSKQELEQRLGVRVEVAAYPYGAANARIERLAAELYRAAFGTRLGHVRRASRLMNLERIDAYYLRRFSLIDRLDTRAGAAYVALRRFGRAARRVVRPAKLEK